MSGTVKFKKEKEILTEYESQVKGKIGELSCTPDCYLSADVPDLTVLHPPPLPPSLVVRFKINCNRIDK